jgi:hypothetical protein
VFLGGGGCTGEIQGAKEEKKPNVSKHVWWRSPTRVALLEYLLTNVNPCAWALGLLSRNPNAGSQFKRGGGGGCRFIACTQSKMPCTTIACHCSQQPVGAVLGAACCCCADVQYWKDDGAVTAGALASEIDQHPYVSITISTGE